MTEDSVKISEFANAHPELLVIVANPITDRLFMSYKGRQVYNQIKNAEGKEMRVVENMLRRSTFGSHIDHFITSLVDIFQVSLLKANEFYKWIDGGVFNLAIEKGRNSLQIHGTNSRREGRRESRKGGR